MVFLEEGTTSATGSKTESDPDRDWVVALDFDDKEREIGWDRWRSVWGRGFYARGDVHRSVDHRTHRWGCHSFRE